MIDIAQAIKSGMTIFKVIESLFSEIYDELGKVYTDLAEVHFLSAKQAYNSVKNSKNPEVEIRTMIAHLRDSHNIYHTVSRRVVSFRTLLFFTGTTKPDCNRKTTILACNLATIVAILYKDLGEIENATIWKKIAFEDFDYYEDNYYENSYFEIKDELKKIDEKYLKYSSDYQRIIPDISDEGKQFLKNRIKKQRDDLNDLLRF